MTPPRGAVLFAAVALSARVLTGCPGPAPDGEDLLRVVAEGVPGGALLSVWGNAGDGALYLAGGYVGVDPARVPGRAGRLVRYRGGAFTTLCRTDAALWWVHGVAGELWAVGDAGAVLRYRDGACERMSTGLTFSEGAPTFWGVYARAPDDVWIVGGSPRPTGPTGVLVHYDGAGFQRVTALPPEALGVNLYKVEATDAGLVVVGAGGVVLESQGSGWAARTSGARTFDNRLFTVSCNPLERGLCLAVGGAGSGVLLARDPQEGWRDLAGLVEDVPGLNGVYFTPREGAYVVGGDGFTMHTDGFRRYVAPSRTAAALHGVGGLGSLVMAVGGELSTADETQRAVVLLRGEGRASYTFDGVAYAARGTLRSSLGGAGQ